MLRGAGRRTDCVKATRTDSVEDTQFGADMHTEADTAAVPVLDKHIVGVDPIVGIEDSTGCNNHIQAVAVPNIQ